MSTISTTIHQSVTVGSASYTSPLMIASTGAVENASAGYAVYSYGNQTIVNQGTIAESGGGTLDAGVELVSGGSLDNLGVIISDRTGVYYNTLGPTGGAITNSGAITAYLFGILGVSSVSIANSGTIDGTGLLAVGIDLSDGGSVSNSGNITGRNGISIFGSTGTIVNTGTIIGEEGQGVYLAAGGNVTNTGTAYISGTGNIGVHIAGGSGTVFNSGTIEGSDGIAVDFQGGATNLLVLGAGAVFESKVEANPSAANTIELTSSAVAGALNGLGSQYVGFQTIAIDSGATWDIAGAAAGFAGVTVTGFDTSDTLDLTDIAFAAGESVTLNSATDVLTVYNSGHGALGSIQLYGDFYGRSFRLASDGASGADITEQKSILTGTYGPVQLDNGLYANPVTLAATALVQARTTGLYSNTAETIVNAGTIRPQPGGRGRPELSYGIHVGGGSSVTNLATGQITADTGIDIAGSGAVVNAGSITASIFYGVLLQHGGTVTNTGHIQGYEGGVGIRNAAGDVINSGTIDGSVFAAVGFFDASGYVSNAAGGVLSGNYGVFANGVATVMNAGAIVGISYGLRLVAGGSIANTGAISGFDWGVFIASGAVTNTGSIGGGLFGVQGGNGTTIDNFGSIGAGAYGFDSFGLLIGDGVVTNESGGTISGYTDAVYFGGNGANRVVIDPGAVFVGTVKANAAGANTIELASGASVGTLGGLGSQYIGFPTVTIDSGATWSLDPASVVETIDNSGAVVGGITLDAGGTIDNSGTISGGAYAVYFGGSGANLLIIDPGAAFDGTVQANAAGTNTIELASGAAAGTLSGLGSQFVGFQTVTIDSGATWSIGAASAMETIDNFGAVTGAGIVLDAGGTVENAGTIGGGTDAVYFGGSGANRLVVDPGAVFDGKIKANPAGANTIELASGASAGALNGLGSQYVGFQTVTIDSGATWDIAGAAAGFAGVTIAGFGVGDVLDLTDIGYAVGETATLDSVTDVLTVYSTADTPLASIQLSGNISDRVFRVTGDGTGGVNVAENSVLTGTYGHTLQLDDGSYANPVTLTSTAVVTAVGMGLASNVAETIVNFGRINGSVAGVDIASGAVTNAGAIGGGAYAILFTGGGPDRLVIDPGAVFDGTVKADAGTNTIELAAGASTGTLSGLGSNYVGFQTVTIDSGASWNIAGTAASFSGVTIQGFHPGDTLDLTDVAYAAGESAKLNSATDVLTVYSPGDAPLASVQLSGDFQGLAFFLTNDGSGGVSIDDGHKSILTGTYVSTVQLDNGTYTNPVTLTSTAVVYGRDLLIGLVSDVAETIVNAGTIRPLPGLRSHLEYGVSVAGGSSITNLDGGYVTADRAIDIAGFGAVINAGVLYATENTVTFTGGGYISNAASGTIATAPTIAGGGFYKNAIIGRAVIIDGAAGTVVNAGTISAVYAIVLDQGGTVTNSGQIHGYYGVSILNAAGGVINYGTIAARLAAVAFRNGSGYVSNAAGGVLSGAYGVFANGVATVVNAGAIVGSGDGLYLAAGGDSVDNTGAISGFDWGVFIASGAVTNTGSIGGGLYGVRGGNGTTIDNFGSIGAGASGLRYGDNSFGILLGDGVVTNESGGTISGYTDAIYFGGSGGDRLIVDAGAVFVGSVVAQGTGNVLELTSTASAGTLTGLGGQFAGFQTLAFGASSKWNVAGSFSGVTTIDGFGFKDTLDLTSLAWSASDTIDLAAGNVLQIRNSGNAVLFSVQLLAAGGDAASYTGDVFQIASDGHGGTSVIVNTPLALTVPGAQSATGSTVLKIAGISVSDPYSLSTGDIITLVLSDGTGLLSASARDGGTVSGSGTTTLTLTGTQTQINGELKTLFYTTTAVGDDTISLHGSATGGTVDETIAVVVGPILTSWSKTGSAFWSNSANWSGGKAPNDVFTDATVALAGGKPVIAAGTSFTVDRLNLDNATAQLSVAGTLTAKSGVTVTAGKIVMQGGALNGALSLAAGTTLSGTGTLGGAVNSAVLVTANGGVLVITGNVSGAGSLRIAAASTLELGGNDGQAITFAAGTPPSGTLILDHPGDAFGTIKGFAIGDTIDLKGVAADSTSLSGGVLTVKDGTTTVAALTLSGSFSGKHFVLSSDSHGGTDITLASGPAPMLVHADRQVDLFSAAVATHSATPAALGDISALNALQDASHAALAASFKL